MKENSLKLPTHNLHMTRFSAPLCMLVDVGQETIRSLSNSIFAFLASLTVSIIAHSNMNYLLAFATGILEPSRKSKYF